MGEHNHRPLRGTVFGAAALLLSLVLVNTLRADPPDPVEELRAALPAFPSAGVEGGDPAALKFRRENLQKKIDALQTLGQLRRALELTEWKDQESTRDGAALIDAAIRTKVGERLQAGLQQIVTQGDPNAKIAAAVMVREMGVSVRSLSVKDSGGYARSLTPLMLVLVRDPDPMVREAGLKAIGKINADLSDGLDTLQAVLKKDDVALRRTAAAILPQLIKTITDLQKQGSAQTGVEVSSKDLIESCRQAAVLAAVGADDADVVVRHGCIEGIYLACNALGQMVPPHYEPKDLPNDGRPLTKKNRDDLNSAIASVKFERQLYEPLIQVLGKQGDLLAKAMNDGDSVQIRLKARLSLEELARARRKIQKREASVPTLNAAGAPPDLLLPALEPSLKQVVNNDLNDARVDVRRAGIYFLEMLEDKAAPAVPALIPLLSDKDVFVRWSAARALGKIGPTNAELSVPELAKRLFDRDLEVRKVAARTLENYGPAAKAAVPQLREAIGKGDAVGRESAIFALRGIGGQDAEPAIPTLIDALANPEARVRRAAVETLGSFGPVARGAVDALRRTLMDEDEEVRRGAADSLLQILAAKE